MLPQLNVPQANNQNNNPTTNTDTQWQSDNLCLLWKKNRSMHFVTYFLDLNLFNRLKILLKYEICLI